MLKLAILLAVTFVVSSAAIATPPALQFNCKVSKVIDDGLFENEHDFTFADYPYVTYMSITPNGKTLTVGALSFSETDSIQSSVITEETEQRMTIIVAEPEESGQIFSLAVSENSGMLYYYSEEANAPREVAELTCD